MVVPVVFIVFELQKLQVHNDKNYNTWTALPSPLQTLIFGGAQLLLSQLPNLEEAKWSSLVAAVASIG